MKMNEEDTQKMTTTPELLIENQLCFTIYACSREMTKLYQPYLDKIGLTYSQYLVMLVLWERQQCTVKEIGEALFLDSGTLTASFETSAGCRFNRA